MKKQLISIAIASTLLAVSAQPALGNTDDSNRDRNDHYVGAGIGAVTGALFAGPIGFIAGGVIGSLAGKHNSAARIEAADPPVADEAPVEVSMPANVVPVEVSMPANAAPAAQDQTEQAIVVARNDELTAVIETDTVEDTSVVEELLVTDINFDVFFLSGSTSVEPFYKPQIQAIARLVRQLPEINIHLEGYSDRRGDADDNLALASQRLDSVRSELELAGVDTGRIQLRAYGEQQFVSRPGDLEAYTFDRRVVIRFEQAPSRTETPVAFIETSPAH